MFCSSDPGSCCPALIACAANPMGVCGDVLSAREHEGGPVLRAPAVAAIRLPAVDDGAAETQTARHMDPLTLTLLSAGALALCAESTIAATVQ